MRTSPGRGGSGLPARRVTHARPTHAVSRFTTLFLTLLCLLGVDGANPVRAQNDPTDDTALRVKVSTDRPTYRVNDPVQITVTIVNAGDRPLDLQFRSGCMVNYMIDGTAFNWLDHGACAAVVSQLHLPPGASHVFPAFIHTPRDYFLTPGSHDVRAEVLGYGRAATLINVSQRDDEPPPAPLLLVADVEPQVVALGGTVRFGVTVANMSRETQTFQTPDGCPVHFTVDGWYQPDLLCTQAAMTYTLAPGERLRLADRALAFDTSVLAPRADAVGTHVADFRVGTAGTTAIRFKVTEAGGTGTDAAIEGTVRFADSQGRPAPASGVLIFASTWEAPIDTLPPPPMDSTRTPNGGGTTPPGPPVRVFGPVRTDASGHYRLAGLPAARYLVRAETLDGTSLWFDGVRDPSRATPVTVTAGQTTGGIDFTLPPFVPPPPRFPGVIEGSIVNWIPEGSRQPQYPIVGAVVVAIMESAIAINDSIPPGGDGDDDDPTRGGAGGGSGNGEPTPIPPDGWWTPRYYGLTDETGSFRIEVPYGTYRVVAGEVTRRYQWWPNADRIDGAQELSIVPGAPTANAGFALKDLDPVTGAASVSGRVLASSLLPPPIVGDSTGRGDSDPAARGEDVRPIEGAQVIAHLLIEDPRLMTPTQLVATNTDAEGRYTLKLRPNSPVIVQAFANGYFGQYFDHVGDIWNATPVDVTPESPTEGVDFDLQQQAIPPDWGNLSGRVTTPDATTVDANGEIPQSPVPGAIVRIRSAQAGFGPFEMVTRADRDGWWFVSGLPYLPDGSLTYLVSAESDGYIPTYHPAALRASEATPVSPMPPYIDALVLVDVSLSRQPMDGPYFLAGHVRGNGGDIPLVGSFVIAERLEGGRYMGVAGAVACDNGTYLLTGLSEGTYRVYADRPGFRTQWFGGDTGAAAAVIQLRRDNPSALLDFTLLPLDGSEPPREDDTTGDGSGGTALNVPMTDLRNAPNPSRAQTTIMYRLKTLAEVTVRIYDINGRLVRTLFDRSLQSPGEQRVTWDGHDENGQTAGAGMYFYRVETARQSATGKMVVVR